MTGEIVGGPLDGTPVYDVDLTIGPPVDRSGEVFTSQIDGRFDGTIEAKPELLEMLFGRER